MRNCNIPLIVFDCQTSQPTASLFNHNRVRHIRIEQYPRHSLCHQHWRRHAPNPVTMASSRLFWAVVMDGHLPAEVTPTLDTHEQEPIKLPSLASIDESVLNILARSSVVVTDTGPAQGTDAERFD